MGDTFKKPKLLVIPSWYVNSQGENPCVFLQAYSKQFENHFDVTVLHVYMMGNFMKCLFRKKFQLEESIEENTRIIRIGIAPLFPLMRTLNYRIAWLLTKWYIQKNLDLPSYKLINSHAFFLGGFIASKIASTYRIPCIHTEHYSGFLYGKTLKTSEKALFSSSLEYIDKLIIVSQHFKNRLAKEFPAITAKSIVIPNFVESSFRYKDPPDRFPFKFLAIGVTTGNKNLNLLLRSWEIFHNKNPNSTLTLLGTDESVLFSLLGNKSLPHSLQVLPFVAHHKVSEIIQQHHCTISTSKQETFGLSLLESLACGRPVITTNSGGILDFVNTNNGIISEDEPIRFASDMESMMLNYNQFHFSEISSEIWSTFSPDQIMSQYLALYRALCS